MDEELDWQVVVDRKPKGYVEINDGKTCIHGPLKDISIGLDDFVTIELKWAAKVALGEFGVPAGGWEAHDITKFLFPNLVVPFVIEDTPRKGERVRWGVGSLIYFDEVEDLVDPTKIKGLNV
jgi:hypothetical protein